MVHLGKNELICDFAEVYHIYDMRLLPAQTVAILACGLRDDSRIKMKITGIKVPDNILLLAHAVDRLSILVWQNTKDGSKGRNKPESIADLLLHGDKKVVKKGTVFNTPEEYWAERKRILGKE